MITAAAKTKPHVTTIIVSNLADETHEEDLRSLFSHYGAVRKIRLNQGTPNRRHQGLGYLDMAPQAAATAISALDGKVFNGSILSVEKVSASQDAVQSPEQHSAESEPTPKDEAPSNLIRRNFQVASLEKVAMPNGAEGDDWYRYVLSSGRSRITGFHRGSLEEVREYAENCAEEFNLRSIKGKSTRALGLTKKK